ncbi:MAG: InlB B-repeat-containing protein, partial [Paludibacteraceae bacterium]|nr:InlB B-repeat-containing protein [Paludibacteraceae bacterium]
MKKLFSLFVPLLALFLTLAPMTAKAAPIDPASTTTATPFTIYHTGTESGFNGRLEIAYEGDWSNADKPILQYKIFYYNGSAATNWQDATISSNKIKMYTQSCSGGNTYFCFAAVTSTSYPAGWAIQFRLKSGSTWNVNKTHWITFKFRYLSTNTAIGLTGNIMSLVANNFENVTEIPSAACFYKLFSDDTSSTNNVDIQCNNLLLPATTLKDNCYENMFSECVSFLKKGPNIMAFNPETDCATDCFKNMFNGCSAMTELTTSFLTWGSGAGTTNWLNGCSACTTVNCPSDLDVSTKDASHIGTAYTSGSGNVTPNVYIFKVAETNGTWPGGCTADKYITTSAPSVPNPVGTPSFAGWYSEDCVPTDITGLGAPSGTKYYYAEFTGSVTVPYTITFKDENGTTIQTKNCRPGHVPAYTGNTDLTKSGYDLSWSPAIVAATENATYTATYVPKDYFTITNKSDGGKNVVLKKKAASAPTTNYHIRIYNPSTSTLSAWSEISISNTTGQTWSIPAGGYIQFYGKNDKLGSSSSNYTIFALADNNTSSFKISGNILYLVACSDGETLDDFEMPSYCFYGLFYGHSYATLDAGELKLPSTTIASNCYASMFNGCKFLSNGPKELPAETLPSSCYNNMFYNCNKLLKAPDIKGTTYNSSAAQQMFEYCSELQQIRVYRTTWGNNNYWVRNISNQRGVFYCPPSLSNATFGASNIPTEWTVYSYDVTFKVKSGGNWVDGNHFDWKEDVSVITGFLDTEDDAETEFFTDADCAEAHKVSITDIKNALPRVANTTPQPAKTYYMRKKVVTYSLAWNTNGGSELTGTYTSGDVEAGEAITAPADPTKSGFVFAGWKDENDNDFTGFMPAANTTYTAQWKHEYTITTTCDNGSVALTANGYTPQNGSGTYLEGTTLTMSVTLNDGYRFVRWNDNDTQNPRAITVSEDASYTAVTEEIPTHWARFYDADGTTLKYAVQVREGSAISYGGAEPDKYGYVFDGWSSDIGVMGDDDVTFTATYVTEPNFFTIENTHVSAATNVSMVRNNANSPTPTLYVRIYDANNNLQTGWTSITVNATQGTSKALGSIPHGGKMQIYGITGTELAYTTNQDYWIRFSFSGGTPEVSGNILSLTSCSADRKTIGTVNTWPEYYFTNLFYSCSSLVSAENLEMPATTVGNSACRYMFGGCTSLTKAPKTLPAATIGDYSYMFMFYNCSTLVKSPDIHATSITTSGHHSMFLNCVALRQIRTYNTIWETTQITSSFTDWVKNTTLGGAFYCPPTLPRESANFGTYGIPVYSSARWIVYSYDVTFVPLECTWSSAPNSGNRQFTWETDVVNVTNFLTAESAANAQFYESDGTTPVSAETIISRLSSETSARIYKVRKVSSYTLAWDANGGALSGDYTAAGSVNAGATITAPTATRTGYTFTGWSPDFTGTMPAANTTYIAQWTKATTLDLYDDQDATYYNNIKALNGLTYDVTYHRSVKYESDNGNARWYTLCLPFDVDQSQLDLNGLTGKVYEYRYAEGSADENDHVTFHFRAVKSTNYMVAGQGYLVNATGDMGPDF